jgi:hypothetical protein
LKKKVNAIIKKLPFYYRLHNWNANKKQTRELVAWERQGKPIPPPHKVKQQTLQIHAQRFGLSILVETGTYHGDMVESMKHRFNRIYSIELSHRLYTEAKDRFKSATHIELIHGDSGVELAKLMKVIDEPALFWLDGHYSAGETARGNKDTPIYEELAHILGAPDHGHVIIIDDARCFGTDPAYPSIQALEEFIRSKRPNIDILVQDDSIRILPNRSSSSIGNAATIGYRKHE